MINEIGHLILLALGQFFFIVLVFSGAAVIAVPASPYLILALLFVGVANSQQKPSLSRKQLLALSYSTIAATIAPAAASAISVQISSKLTYSQWAVLTLVIYVFYSALLVALWIRATRREKYGILLFWVTGAYFTACMTYAAISIADEIIKTK